MVMDTKAYFSRPLPKLEGLTGEYYGWLKQHELRFQRCTQCGHWRHVPRELCPECGSGDWEWARSSGKGTVFTWSTIYRPLHPGFMNDAPYATVVVELEEGPRVLTWLVDVPPDEIAFDMPVEVVFDDVTDKVTLAKFKRAG